MEGNEIIRQLLTNIQNFHQYFLGTKPKIFGYIKDAPQRFRPE